MSEKQTILFSAPYMVPFVGRFQPVFDHYGLELIVAEVEERLEEEDLLAYAGQFDGAICGDDRFTARVIEAHSPREGMASEQQTPVVYGDHLWTILPKDAGELRSQLACYHVSDLQNPVWTSGKENRFGLGPYIIINDRMYLVNDNAELYMFRFGINSVDLIDSKVVIEEGIDSWGPCAYADGYLLIRDSYNMVCLDLTSTGNSTISNRN